jgi:hypothetical protein
MRKKDKNQIEFAAHVLSLNTQECVIWPFTKDRHGYGYSPSLLDRRAHRSVFRLAHGAIAKGNVVMHSCDNPSCVNPKHLVQGTQKANIDDMHSKGRAYLGGGGSMPDNRGERHGRAVLTTESVIEIRSYAGTESQSALATMFGVSRQAISAVLCRRTWKHVI